MHLRTKLETVSMATGSSIWSQTRLQRHTFVHLTMSVQLSLFRSLFLSVCVFVCPCFHNPFRLFLCAAHSLHACNSSRTFFRVLPTHHTESWLNLCMFSCPPSSLSILLILSLFTSIPLSPFLLTLLSLPPHFHLYFLLCPFCISSSLQWSLFRKTISKKSCHAMRRCRSWPPDSYSTVQQCIKTALVNKLVPWCA